MAAPKGIKKAAPKKRAVKKDKIEETKDCPICQKRKKLTDFFGNRGWIEERKRDRWCRDCVRSYCINEERCQQYFYYNNRLWDEKMVATASQKVIEQIDKDTEYNRENTSQEKREKIYQQYLSSQILQIMSFVSFYKYVENDMDEAPPLHDMKISIEPEDLKTRYYAKWGGTFTKKQIEKLEEYYQGLAKDFPLDNQNIRDYAQQVAKASLIVDIMSDKVTRGAGKIEDLQKAISNFDKLSNSATFAKIRQKNTEAAGFGSFGELVRFIEDNGYIQMCEEEEYPPDQIDAIIKDFAHIVDAIGLGGND